MGGNRLSGQIPPELGELPKLNTLTGNRFSGCVPPRLRNVAWENDLGSLGLLLCDEEMALFRDAWDRFQLQMPAEWAQLKPDFEETVFQSYEFQFYNPDGSWEVTIFVVDVGLASLAEYADEMESAFLKENLGRVVRSTVQTSQGLKCVALDASLGEDAGMLFNCMLDGGVVISVVYAFPATWSEAGKDLALRSFGTFLVH